MSEKFVQRGLKNFLKEKWQEAEDDFVQAVEINDISVKGWYYLALCRAKLKDGEGASLCFKKAMNAAKMQDPEDDDTMRNSLMELAKIQVENAQYIAALGFLKKILPMDFKDNDFRGDVYALLGKIYDSLNKKEYALFNYRQATKYGNKRIKNETTQLENQGIRPDDPDDKDSPNLLKRKGDILFGQQKFEDAIVQYTETIKMNNTKKVLSDVDHAEVTMKIAYAYINIQDFPKARDYLIEAKRLFSRTTKEDEIRTIESTLNKINSLMSV
nr:hypothetical protein [Candidatus Sigynarchaeota archaeon]